MMGIIYNQKHLMNHLSTTQCRKRTSQNQKVRRQQRQKKRKIKQKKYQLKRKKLTRENLQFLKSLGLRLRYGKK